MARRGPDRRPGLRANKQPERASELVMYGVPPARRNTTSSSQIVLDRPGDSKFESGFLFWHVTTGHALQDIPWILPDFARFSRTRLGLHLASRQNRILTGVSRASIENATAKH